MVCQGGPGVKVWRAWQRPNAKQPKRAASDHISREACFCGLGWGQGLSKHEGGPEGVSDPGEGKTALTHWIFPITSRVISKSI